MCLYSLGIKIPPMVVYLYSTIGGCFFQLSVFNGLVQIAVCSVFYSPMIITSTVRCLARVLSKSMK